MSDIAKELFKSIVTDTASQEDFGSAIKQKMEKALDVRRAGVTADIYNQQVPTPETVVEESTDIEESAKNKVLAKDLEKLIKNPDPSRVKEYGGGTKYVDMLKSKLAKLQEDNTEITEASSGDITKILKFAAKNGAKVKGNVVDFGGSKIEFSLDKGKIKFDGGKDSGVEHFDNVRDAISTLSIGMEV